MTNDELPLVICDLDGTVVDLLAEICAFIFRATGVPLTPDRCWTYNLHDAFSCYLCSTAEGAIFASDEALKTFLSRTCYHNPDLYKQAKPHWGLWRALTNYMRAGGRVHILTARGRHLHGVKDATEHWVSQWLPDVYNIHYAEDYDGGTTPQRKRYGCYQISYTEPSIIIDDSPEVIRHLCEHEQKNWKILMPERPWTVNGCDHPKAALVSASAYLEAVLADHRRGVTSNGTTH